MIHWTRLLLIRHSYVVYNYYDLPSCLGHYKAELVTEADDLFVYNFLLFDTISYYYVALFFLLQLLSVFLSLRITCTGFEYRMFGNGVFTTHFYVYEQGTLILLSWWFLFFPFSLCTRSHGVMASALDSVSSDPSSNLGGTCQDFFFALQLSRIKHRFRHLIFICLLVREFFVECLSE